MRAFSRTALTSDINVTPLVDVCLVLLIIFMVVTPALVAGFQAQLPVGMNLRERPEEEGRTTLGIDAHGAYYLDTRPVPMCTAADRQSDSGKARCASELRGRLSAAFQSHPQDRVLFVKADAGLKYQEMIDVMRLGEVSPADKTFYEGKVAAAQFFARNVQPKLTAERAIAENIDDSIMELDESAF